MTFRTVISNRYLGADRNGGGAVRAIANAADAWETFTLLDIGGGTLENGDAVYVRTGSGHFLRAAGGGGGALDAVSTVGRAFERFRIMRRGGAGTVRTGDVVALQASSGSFVSAANGGGGDVFAYGPGFGPWEELVIALGASVPAATRIDGVHFRAQIAPRFLGATEGGGGDVRARASVADAWETFSLLDDDGGALEHGDEVHILTSGGRFLRAENGGGGALDARGVKPLGWETFRVVRAAGSGVVQSGDVVGLEAATTGRFVSAQNGGGGDVFAYGTSLGDWERFTVTLGETTWVTGAGTSGYRLVWADEFDGPGIDETKWVYEVQGPRWVNNELQRYTDRRPENARIENGALVIEARRDFFQGSEYSSARLKTQGRASFTYGRVEARIRVPGGWGTWPAFWMMPDDQHRGWPACGEIDIMEHVGYDADRVHGTTHSLAYNWRSPNQRTASTVVPNAPGDFHVYALEWTPEAIEVSVDGQVYFSSPNDHTGDDAWPFDKRFHVILNLAVGGDWGGARGVDPNIWPRQMRVDYVRVYQR